MIRNRIHLIVLTVLFLAGTFGFTPDDKPRGGAPEQATSDPKDSFDPSDFFEIDGEKIKISEDFFDQVTNCLGVTVIQQTGDAATGKEFISFKLNNKFEKVEIYEMECCDGFTVSRQNGGNSETLEGCKKKIQIKRLHCGMNRKEVERSLVLGKKLKGGYVGNPYVYAPNALINDYSLEKNEWVSRPDVEKPNKLIRIYKRKNDVDDGEIMVNCYFDSNDILIKFDIYYLSC